MDKAVRVIEIKQNVFAKNEINAEKIRENLKKEKTYMINLMASPGACINVAILSAPEGDDKPLKYPLMFQVNEWRQ